MTLANVEAEQAYLGCLLTNGEVLGAVARPVPEDFTEVVHREIFTEIVKRTEEDGYADPVLLMQQFSTHPTLQTIGGSKYLARMAAASASVINLPAYVAELRRLTALRKLVESCQQAIADATESEKHPAEIAAMLGSQIASVTHETGKRPVTDGEVINQILDALKDNRRPVSTGLYKLDACMGGGLYPGKSYGFAARKKVGKTVLAGTISYNLSEAGFKHLFICGEMGPQEIHERTLARHLNVHPFCFRGDVGRDANFQIRISNAYLASKNNILYQDAPGLTFNDLKQYVSTAVAKHKISGFILDYWQLVGGKPKGVSTAEHLDSVAQWISDFSRQHGLWSITMAQINQEGNTRGGEGLRLAFDQVYQLHRDDPSAGTAWLEMMDTRYTAWMNIGDKTYPGWFLNEKGPYFEESA